MDQASQENLQRILGLAEHLLTVEDKRFLHARRPYLTKSQLNDYADVLAEVESWNRELKDDDGNLIYGKDGKATKKAAPKEPVQEQTEVQPQQTTQYQDKDTRLNLDTPPADQANQTQQAENTGGNGSEVECLDPDCTHENHQ